MRSSTVIKGGHKLFQWVWVGVLLSINGNAFAGLYQSGIDAYRGGDYSSAYDYWASPLLDQEPIVQFNLGVLLEKGQGVLQDFEESVIKYRSAAELGFASAQYNLGLAYYLARGVEQDLSKSYLWWEKAAQQNHANAQYNLASLLWSGRGVVKDEDQSLVWLNKALEKNHLQAQAFLDHKFDPLDDNLVQRMLETAGENTNESLGNRASGTFAAVGAGAYQATAQDESIVQWASLGDDENNRLHDQWLAEAQQGSPQSQYNIGQLYEKGLIGVTADLNRAIEWYQSAANLGLDQAQHRLGHFYISEADAPNRSLGMYWMQTAADQGYAPAVEYMQSLR